MEILIPTSLKEVKLKTLMAWEQSDKTDDDLLSVFCGINDSLKLPVKDRKEIIETLTDLLKSDIQFEKTFKFEGVEFGFIPKLDSLSGEEFIDVEEFGKEPNNWHKVMSVLYRPVIKRKRNWFKRNAHDLYDIMPYSGSQWSATMLETPCVYYLGAMVFFYSLGNDLLGYMRDYSIQLENKTQKSKTSIQNGVGTLV